MFKDKWHPRFLNMAKLVSTWSKDPSTKCGAIIVDTFGTVRSQGYNGFPRGMSDSEELYLDRDYKYAHTIHAEMNAVINVRQAIDGHTVYTWPMLPCVRCAVILANSHIRCVVSQRLPPELVERWGESIEKSKDVFRRLNVKVIELETVCD